MSRFLFWSSSRKVLREKKKGDYLVENKMYVNAVKIYENALLKEDKEGLGEQFRGGIYHNMGCAYLHLFQFEEAARMLFESIPVFTYKAGSFSLSYGVLYGKSGGISGNMQPYGSFSPDAGGNKRKAEGSR